MTGNEVPSGADLSSQGGRASACRRPSGGTRQHTEKVQCVRARERQFATVTRKHVVGACQTAHDSKYHRKRQSFGMSVPVRQLATTRREDTSCCPTTSRHAAGVRARDPLAGFVCKLRHPWPRCHILRRKTARVLEGNVQNIEASRMNFNLLAFGSPACWRQRIDP